ncbi:MAG: HD domain-containing protein [Thermoguttaceae bacterium]|nr:HD domain-containing protein [Thermoguttaceae bacterium]
MQPPPVKKLAEMQPGQEADLFVLMTTKEQHQTREGKPYYKVGFRDASREIVFPIWADSPWAEVCRTSWTPGQHYKIRAVYRETPFGPQLDIRKIRPVVEADRQQGFDPLMCLPRSRQEPRAMWEELNELVQEAITDSALKAFIQKILHEYREQMLVIPAAKWHHHAYLGGWLEHTLQVTRHCRYLAQQYRSAYPDLQPPVDVSLTVAGAILHDLGKLREIQLTPTGIHYTPEGELVGHVLLGRDMLREAAADCPLPEETLLRLEHIIISHQREPDWGAPKPPMTPEAFLVHYADDLDAKFQMVYTALMEEPATGPFTTARNVLGQKLFRGLPPEQPPPA